MTKLKRDGGSRRRVAGSCITGAELRAMRVKAGLSQVQLAKLAGYHAVYVGAMERGEVKITARALLVLKSTLRVA